MTQVATQITLSLADRVRDWSRQERDLAMALRGLHSAPLPTPAPTPLLLGESPLSVHSPSPLVIESPVPWVKQPVGSFGAYEVAPLQPLAPVRGAPHVVEAVAPMPIVPNPHVAPPGPFDEFLAAVTDPGPDPLRSAGPLPPPSRFMVRVAPVGKPHRATKRNYDYFEELNLRLAAQAASREQNGRQ
jgi:hypothetical protein